MECEVGRPVPVERCGEGTGLAHGFHEDGHVVGGEAARGEHRAEAVTGAVFAEKCPFSDALLSEHRDVRRALLLIPFTVRDGDTEGGRMRSRHNGEGPKALRMAHTGHPRHHSAPVVSYEVELLHPERVGELEDVGYEEIDVVGRGVDAGAHPASTRAGRSQRRGIRPRRARRVGGARTKMSAESRGAGAPAGRRQARCSSPLKLKPFATTVKVSTSITLQR